MFSAISNFLKKRASQKCRIASNQHGVRFINDGVEFQAFSWDRVRRIVAYKKDILTTDLVCIEFELDGSEAYVAHEELAGFEQLADNMRAAFPNIDPHWFFKVMRPAFERSFMILFDARRS